MLFLKLSQMCDTSRFLLRQNICNSRPYYVVLLAEGSSMNAWITIRYSTGNVIVRDFALCGVYNIMFVRLSVCIIFHVYTDKLIKVFCIVSKKWRSTSNYIIVISTIISSKARNIKNSQGKKHSFF